jgi:hypothetical protein
MKYLFIFLLILSGCENKKSLQSKYPLKLLSDDYGILKESDMHDKGFLEDIGEFSTEPSSAPRWICFDVKDFTSKCINVSYSEKFNTNSGDLDMVVKHVRKEYRFSFNSIVSNEICEEHRAEWKKVMDGEKYFCLSSTLLAIDKRDSNKISGIFYRLKTKKGCDSWFVDHCN